MTEALCNPADWIERPLLHDIAAIQARIPQRYEMALLHGILHFDPEQNVGIGVHHAKDTDFWVRGHMPGRPLMPGVVMVEVAAQLCAWIASFSIPSGPGHFFAFAGIDEARFRGQVHPGDRLLVAAQLTRTRGALTTLRTQAFVGTGLVFEGNIMGVTI